MANPTSNFGWQMPTPTDLVTDLPADFEVFGQAVDTSLADLKGGTTGQVLAKNSNTNMDFVWVAQDDSNAIQNAIVDAKGDLIAASANDTPARLAVGNNGETLVADSSTSTGLRYTENYAAGKNKIINGDFAINQRNFTTASTNFIFMFDRFVTRITDGGGSVTCTAETFTPGTAPVAGYEGKNFLRIVSSGQSTTAARAGFDQLIESVRTFAGQTITVSFWARANTGTPSISVELVQNFGTGGSPSASVTGSVAAGTVVKKAISTSWARYSYTITVPSIAGKTLGTNNNDFCQIIFWLSAGSNQDTRTDSLGIQNNTFDIWGVQAEAGSVATAFQTATGTIQGELAACQRYYFRMGGDAVYQPITMGIYGSATVIQGYVKHPTTMRVVPTSVDFSTLRAYTAGAAAVAVTAATINQGGKDMTDITFTAATGSFTNTVGLISANNSTSAYFGLSAEL